MFRLEIVKGNEAMQTPEDVAAALERVAERLKDGCICGVIADRNGNIVGKWSNE